VIPQIESFKPLPKQWELIRDIRTKFDYSKGTHEILLSGSVGSSKSLALAHLAITHCIMNPGAKVGIGRRTLPSLKDTLFATINDHLGENIPAKSNRVRSTVEFDNGSIIRSFSWADAHHAKFRSHEFSAFFIEELTENEDQEFYDEIAMRVGRIKDIKEKIIVCATNPDDPEHWAFKYFIDSQNQRRHVYYSKTSDNPYLPDSYISQLEENLDPKMARRMIHGEWLAIRGEVIYHQYDDEKNRTRELFTPNPKYPIHWCWDFNIGDGKPLSTCFFQFIDSRFHIFKDIVIEGLRTEDMLEEANGQGLLDIDTEYIINGDATGKARSTKSRHSDYDIIKNYLSNATNRKGHPIRFKVDVPLANPKVRERHNLVNAWLNNEKGSRRVIVYPNAPTVHEGLRLTKLKPGADYIEDDSKSFQHVTTALGYGICAKVKEIQAEDNQMRVWVR
jgi:hypothetical protein